MKTGTGGSTRLPPAVKPLCPSHVSDLSANRTLLLITPKPSPPPPLPVKSDLVAIEVEGDAVLRGDEVELGDGGGRGEEPF